MSISNGYFHTRTHTHAHTRTHAHTHAHTHTYTHTHVCFYPFTVYLVFYLTTLLMNAI